jgi:hypothetical protein
MSPPAREIERSHTPRRCRHVHEDNSRGDGENAWTGQAVEGNELLNKHRKGGYTAAYLIGSIAWSRASQPAPRTTLDIRGRWGGGGEVLACVLPLQHRRQGGGCARMMAERQQHRGRSRAVRCAKCVRRDACLRVAGVWWRLRCAVRRFLSKQQQQQPISSTSSAARTALLR